VTPEATGHLDKARECLTRARIILAAGVAEDAARNAYLAAFHAAQALVAARTGRDAKTHSFLDVRPFGRSDRSTGCAHTCSTKRGYQV
jgi:uncharacterized protein (UPF0332 family)